MKVAALLIAFFGFQLTAFASVPLVKDLQRQLGVLHAKKPSLDRWVQEARLQFYLGKLATDKGTQEAHFSEGMRRATEARKLNYDDPGASLWWAVNLGGIAGVRKNFASLSLVRDIERELISLKSRDADYDAAGADRRLGRLYQKAPKLISIGSMRKAGLHLHEAFKRFPGHPANQIYLADYLFEKREYRRARDLAQAALKSPRLIEFPYDAPEWKEIASQVIEKASKKIK